MTTELNIQNDPLDGVTTRCHRVLLTGAGGNLGKVLRERLPKYADFLRLSDISNLGEARTGEEIVPCDLADAKAVDALVAGTDAIVHLGGVSVERPFEEILPTTCTKRRAVMACGASCSPARTTPSASTSRAR
jgi:uronate dehydrogenase